MSAVLIGLSGLAAVMALMLALPVLVLLVQVLAARMFKAPDIAQDAGWVRPGVAVLIPAHNEAAVIQATLASLLPQLQADDVVLVVADNCQDDTAALARSLGVTVSERFDTELRGKGYALAHGMAVLKQATPRPLVLILDADCTLESGSITALAWRCASLQRPAQALYLMEPPANASLSQRISALAWRVRNWVRPLGWARLGLPCQLMGTGMAFPWDLLMAADLANGHLVEDMKLGLDLACQGRAPFFEERARVISHFPETAAASASQRTRWEHGHLSLLLQQAPRLLAQGVRRGDRHCLAMALDLSVPPLALLVTLLMAVWCLSAGVALCGGAIWPWYVSSASVAAMGLAVFFAWTGWGRAVIGGWQLLGAPGYVLKKLPIYLRFWRRRQTEWVRTERR